MRKFFQFQFVAIALLFGLLVIAPPTGAFAGEAMNEAAFKKLLVRNSPWSVTWDIIEWGKTGTHKISFANTKDAPTFTGKMFGFAASSSSTPGQLEHILLRVDDDKNCLQFSSQRGHEYNYCLTQKGTLEGTQEGFSTRGNSFTAEVIAKPQK